MSATTATANGISEQLVSEYHRQGYAVMRQVLDPTEVAELATEMDRLFADPWLTEPQGLRAHSRPTSTGGRIVDRLDPVIDVSPLLGRLSGDARLTEAAGALLDDAAQLLKAKAISKPPGTHGYGVHQDYTTWQELPVPAEGMMTVIVAVDAAGARNGGLLLYPGLHDRHRRPAETPRDLFQPTSGLLEPGALEGHAPERAELEPGDCLLMGSLVPHSSDPNLSDDPRRLLFFTYSQARYGDLYQLFYTKFHEYLQVDRSAAASSD